VRVDEVGAIDLVVTGCVAAARDGSRLGKGGGYSDLEYAMLRRAGKLDEDVPIATTVHPSQLAPDDGLPMLAHDLSLDWIATPFELIQCRRSFARPRGIDWAQLDDARRRAIPALEGERARAPSHPPTPTAPKSRFATK
jgi:5-formyltetrahydrofolate cyclo-ligase